MHGHHWPPYCQVKDSRCSFYVWCWKHTCLNIKRMLDLCVTDATCRYLWFKFFGTWHYHPARQHHEDLLILFYHRHYILLNISFLSFIPLVFYVILMDIPRQPAERWEETVAGSILCANYAIEWKMSERVWAKISRPCHGMVLSLLWLLSGRMYRSTY